MPDLILEALTNAVQHADDPTLAAAYRQLTHIVGMTITGQPLAADKPLTPTQIIFLRNALRHLSPTQLTALQSAADQVRNASTQVTITDSTVINNQIGTVSGGTVTMIGVNNAPDPKTDTLPKPPAGFPPHSADSSYAPAGAISVDWAHDVFISYSRHDAIWARRIYGDLRAAGFFVWMDDQLTPGTPSWQLALEKAIRAAGCIVVLLSPAIKDSEWVEREIKFAQTHQRPIVPLLIAGDDKNAIPLALCNIQWTSIRDNREYRANLPRIIAAIRGFNA